MDAVAALIARILLSFAQLTVFVLLVEALTQAVTVPAARWPRWPHWADQVVAFVFAVGACLLFRANAFAAAGFVMNPEVGQVFTGVIVSRGSNFWHDLTARVADLVKPLAPSTVPPVGG